MNQAINAYEVITSSEVFRERTRLLEKARHDEIGILNYARDEARAEGLSEGMEKGREEGRAEGLSEGREEGRGESLIDNIKSLMVTLHLTIEQAMDALRIPETEHRRYLDMLAAQ